MNWFKYLKGKGINKVVKTIALGSNDDKIMQEIDSTETHAYGTRKDIIYVKEKIKRKNIIKQYKNV